MLCDSKDETFLNNRGGSTWCIGNGQIISAMSLCYEVSQTLNCMHDSMAILVVEDEQGNKS
jgi:hypothetical protein